jgi:hypothetical protein
MQVAAAVALEDILVMAALVVLVKPVADQMVLVEEAAAALEA